jgi:hypothetical protein
MIFSVCERVVLVVYAASQQVDLNIAREQWSTVHINRLLLYIESRRTRETERGCKKTTPAKSSQLSPSTTTETSLLFS